MPAHPEPHIILSSASAPPPSFFHTLNSPPMAKFLYTALRNNQWTEAELTTRRAETIDGLEENWQEEKLLIDEKSRNNRRTEAERATRRAETIDGLKRNGRLEEQTQSTD